MTELSWGQRAAFWDRIFSLKKSISAELLWSGKVASQSLFSATIITTGHLALRTIKPSPGGLGGSGKAPGHADF